MGTVGSEQMASELPWCIDNNDLFNYARSGPREIGYEQNGLTIIAPARETWPFGSRD
jgi:hypothetical protein